MKKSQLAKLEMWPLHRWLAFADSWPPEIVENILATIEVGPEELVYDPFVGCGTTPLVCADRGLATLSCDASRLAVFVARMKLQPPSLTALAGVERRLCADGIENLLLQFTERRWPPELPPLQRRSLQFLLAASLLRVGWHEGVKLHLRRMQTEAMTLLGEMRADLAGRERLRGEHHLHCRNFRDDGLAMMAARGNRRVVMVSSPPFFGSNVNPAKQRLADLLGRPRRPTAFAPRPADWQVVEKHSLLDRLLARGELFEQVADYLFFLDSLAARAATLDCRAAAIEMGAKTIAGEMLRFDLFLAERLEQRRYRVEVCRPPLIAPVAKPRRKPAR